MGIQGSRTQLLVEVVIGSDDTFLSW